MANIGIYKSDTGVELGSSSQRVIASDNYLCFYTAEQLNYFYKFRREEKSVSIADSKFHAMFPEKNVDAINHVFLERIKIKKEIQREIQLEEK